MIIAKLMGGLGNQMFQYAAAISLATKLKVPLLIDSTYLEDHTFKPNFTYREFSLSCFNITGKVIDQKKREHFLLWNDIFLKSRLSSLNRYLFSTKVPIPKTFARFDHGFHAELLKLSANTLLEGYWQSEKYFTEIAPLIRKEFSFKQQPDQENQSWLSLITKIESVSVHIRRGDYINNSHINSVHGTCDVNYYTTALELMAQKVTGMQVFFFSDDLSWAEEQFKKLQTKYPVHFINNNTEDKSYEDLRLMSNCKHNIIANSSFSWWGAWLNDNPAKKVIAPKKWFKDPSVNTDDLIPETWIRI